MSNYILLCDFYWKLEVQSVFFSLFQVCLIASKVYLEEKYIRDIALALHKALEVFETEDGDKTEINSLILADLLRIGLVSS